MKFILGKKQGMSQIFDKEGKIVPVTVIEAGPCFVTQINPVRNQRFLNGVKTHTIQIGYEKLKEKKVGKSKKNKPYRYLKEFSIFQPTVDQPEAGKKIGDKISVDIFKEGDIIKVSGTSKGKGFQGVVKRHGFSGGPASHGHRHVLRTPGSIGSMFPQRVVKGKKMPGHAGAERVTITGLKIVKVDKENNLLAVKGAISGANGGLIEIKSQ